MNVYQFIKDKRENLRHERLFKSKIEQIEESGGLNKKIVILSSDCTGGRIMKDFRLPSYTPTVNVHFYKDHFIKFCEDIEKFASAQIMEVKEPGIEYPIGDCEGVLIHFGHETDFNIAQKKWSIGCKQLLKAIKGPHEIWIIDNDRNDFEYEYMDRFDNLPYRKKVIFTHKPTPYKSSFYMEGEDDNEYVDIMTSFEHKFFGVHRRYDRFDFYSWLQDSLKEKAEDSYYERA